MKLVVIESPYADDVEGNKFYLRRCMIDSLMRGEAPFASHMLYTTFLNDEILSERRLGIGAGFAWGAQAELVAVYVDRGVSSGMDQGIARALEANQAIEFRSLDGVDLADFPDLRRSLPSSSRGEWLVRMLQRVVLVHNGSHADTCHVFGEGLGDERLAELGADCDCGMTGERNAARALLADAAAVATAATRPRLIQPTDAAKGGGSK